MNYSPVAVFAYNRLDTLKKTIYYLQKNEECKYSDLFIFIDGPKNDDGIEINSRIYEFCKKITGFKSITIDHKTHNFGLAKSIISGVSQIIEKYKKIIVIEDDILVSNKFLSFMNESLDFYKDDKRIWSVGGYMPQIKIKNLKDVYFSQRTESWGWACWDDRWFKADWNVKNYDEFIKDKRKIKSFNKGGKDLTNMLRLQHDGKIHSWSIRFDFAAFENNGLTVHPPKSLTANIGCNSLGTNFDEDCDYFDTVLVDNFKPNLVPYNTDRTVQKIASKFYKPSIFRRCINKIKKIICKK